MKKALLLALALTAVGCAEGELEESASCADLSVQSPLESLNSRVEQGDAGAQAELGFFYVRGICVPQDDAEAVRCGRGEWSCSM
jgi:TPR repeat protein